MVRIRGLGNLKNPITLARAVKKIKSLPDNNKLDLPTVEGAFTGQKGRDIKYQIGWLKGMKMCSNDDTKEWIDDKIDELKREEGA